MADFCMNSSSELCDIQGIVEEGYVTVILCEGCGYFHMVDHEGYKMIWSDTDKQWVREQDDQLP